MGVRRVRALLRGLPPDSATGRALGVDWTNAVELAAVNVELTHTLLRSYVSAHSKQGARLPEPLHIPRPWDTPTTKRRQGTSMAELRTIIGKNIKRAEG